MSADLAKRALLLLELVGVVDEHLADALDVPVGPPLVLVHFGAASEAHRQASPRQRLVAVRIRTQQGLEEASQVGEHLRIRDCDSER